MSAITILQEMCAADKIHFDDYWKLYESVYSLEHELAYARDTLEKVDKMYNTALDLMAEKLWDSGICVWGSDKQCDKLPLPVCIQCIRVWLFYQGTGMLEGRK